MVTVKLEDGSVVKGELVRSEKKPAAKSLSYRILEGAPTAVKSKQRNHVLAALHTDPTKFFTVAEVAKLCTESGLSSVYAVADSAAYHLHNLKLLGSVEAK